MKWFFDLRNNIDFFIREKTKFSKKNYNEIPQNVEDVFEDGVLLRLEELCAKYNVNKISVGTTIQNYKENLYILDILDKYFEIEPKDKLKVLDIGCKNWFYAKGEHAFFEKYSKKLELKGIEIDAHRLYSNFYSRVEVAKFYIKNLKSTEYLSKDFLKYDEKMDYMVWFLPFVKENPHISWGLPLMYFSPKQMLWHAYFSLNKGGRIFIVNQGEDEYRIQKDLLAECAIPYIEIGQIDSEFLCYNNKRYALVVIKKGVEDEND